MSRLPDRDPECTERGGAAPLLIAGKPRDIGGLEVRRMLPSSKRRMVGPFVFFDHMGPAAFAPGHGLDVRPHPHIGLATVTYLFAGEIVHRDSLGIVQAIRPGAVNWMTAGRGIVHSERTGGEARARGAALHGIQSWVALPMEREDDPPAFRHHAAETLPVIESDGARMRLVAGTAFGESAPVETASPMFYLDCALAAGSALPLPHEHAERALYVVAGVLDVAGEAVGPGAMLVFAAGAAVAARAETAARVMTLGGAPFAEKRHIWWNFVASAPERIERAKEDWKAGRFPSVPGESDFIPLPEG